MSMKRKLKFEKADTEKTLLLESYMDDVVMALGHEEAMVTDESYISDFLDVFDEKRREKQLKKAEKILGIKIDKREYVWEVAERLKLGCNLL